MSERHILQLSSDWSIRTDGLQWVLSKAGKSAREGGKNARTERFRAYGYVGGRKTTLLRLAREYSIPITPVALKAIEGWPDTFREWHAQQGERRAA